MKKEAYQYLKEKLMKEGHITSWTWNDTFLKFWEKFYPKVTSTKKVRNAFTRLARKLCEDGHCSKGKRTGIGPGGVNEFGCRTQTTWVRINP